MFGSNCCFLMCIQVLKEAGKVVWYFHLLKNFHGLLWSTHSRTLVQSMKQKYVFLEFSCFFYDPVNVGNLISGFSAFSKSCLYMWKFSVHVLVKSGLNDFEHNPVSMWNECNCEVVCIFLALPFFGIGIKTDFSSPVDTAEFSKFAGVLSAALSQHHLLGFEISQLQSQHLH